MGGAGQRLAGHGVLAAVVPRQDRYPLDRAALPAHQGLHAVARFCGVRALEAHAPACGLGVFGQAAAIGEDQHGMARGRAAVFHGGPAQARFRKQARQEGVVRFAVLRGVGARGQVGQVALDVVGDFVGVALVAVQHVAHDVQHRLVLVDAAVAPLSGQPQPGRQRDAVARLARIAAQHFGGAHDAAASGFAAVGARGPQRGRARHHVIQVQARVLRQRHHARFAQVRQAFARDPAFHLQGRQRALTVQPVKAGLGAGTAVARVHSHGAKTLKEGRR
ncbi:hypothetical protein D3C72_1143110 [compost metagenome]